MMKSFGLENARLTPFGHLLDSLIGDRSQADFALEIGVPPQTLSNWRTGKVDRPREGSLDGLARASGYSVRKLQAIIKSSNESVGELDSAFAVSIANPANAVKYKLAEYRRGLLDLIKLVSLENGHAELKRRLETLDNVMQMVQTELNDGATTEQAPATQEYAQTL